MKYMMHEKRKYFVTRVFWSEYWRSKKYYVINLYDIVSKENRKISLKFKSGTNTVILIMSGELEIEKQTFKDKNVLIFEQEGNEVAFKVANDFKGLILNGDPIDEPIVTHGPFVMNTKEEIYQAFSDYQNGKMGSL